MAQRLVADSWQMALRAAPANVGVPADDPCASDGLDILVDGNTSPVRRLGATGQRLNQRVRRGWLSVLYVPTPSERPRERVGRGQTVRVEVGHDRRTARSSRTQCWPRARTVARAAVASPDRASAGAWPAPACPAETRAGSGIHGWRVRAGARGCTCTETWILHGAAAPYGWWSATGSRSIATALRRCPADPAPDERRWCRVRSSGAPSAPRAGSRVPHAPIQESQP